MGESLGSHYLQDVLSRFRVYKKQADKAIAQLRDDEIFKTLDAEGNCVAMIMKHMAGNMISRWTDFLITDGEKPNRNRDMEFVIGSETTQQEVLDFWEKGWQALFDALEALTEDKLLQIVSIRGEHHTVLQAVNRQLMHYSNHIGQIIFLAKHFRSTDWKSVSIPRNKSLDFNKYLQDQKPASSADERGLGPK